jgi:hypothetical protein
MSRLSNQHTVTLNHSFDGDNDVTLKILYVYTPGRAARGPTYDCGGEPPEAPEVEVLTVSVTPEYADPHNATEEEFDMVVCSDHLWQKLCDDAEADRQMAKSDR